MEEDAGWSLPLRGSRSQIMINLLAEDLSAIDLEDRLGINESAVRRHLDILEQNDYVEHRFERVARGRPKKVYSITPAGRRIFPRKTYLLFTLLARGVEERYGDGDLKTLLSEVAAGFAERLPPDDSGKVGEPRLRGFVDPLDKFGFYASISEVDGKYDIEYRNCVFGDVASKFDGRLCNMHREIVQNVLPRCDVEIRSSKARGDNLCVHRVTLEDGEAD